VVGVGRQRRVVQRDDEGAVFGPVLEFADEPGGLVRLDDAVPGALV
jgi:hypothetical protein